MYLYAREGLGECKSTSKWARVGPGIDPIGSEKELCPLLRDNGRYLDWLNYVIRTGSPKDPISKFKQFLNTDCYQDYLEMCRRRQTEIEKQRKRRYKNFLKEYELRFNPDPVKFGIDNNPKMTRTEKAERKQDVLTLVDPLKLRFSARAAAALRNEVPIFLPSLSTSLPESMKTIILRLSFLQFNLFREWFPAGNWIQFSDVQDCFEQFANGELRDPSEIGHPGLFEPDSAVYFLFAEFAFLCLELGFHKSFWEQALRTFVKTQEIFMHVYRENPKSPPPPVNYPLRLGGNVRDLNLFKHSNFKQIGSSVTIGEGQSDLKRKMTLRAKYDRMDESVLKAAARDNLRRALLMP